MTDDLETWSGWLSEANVSCSLRHRPSNGYWLTVGQGLLSLQLVVKPQRNQSVLKLICSIGGTGPTNFVQMMTIDC